MGKYIKKRYKNIEKNEAFKILYSIEDNINTSFGDDIQIVKNLLKTAKESLIYIKISYKMENIISNEFLQLIENNSNIIPISFKTSTNDIWDSIDLVVTTFGKIGIKSILTNKPILLLENSILNETINSYLLQKFSELPEFIESIKLNKYQKISKSEQIVFLNRLIESSFKGIVIEPTHLPSHLFKINLDHIIKAFKTILEFVKDDKI